ncbi:cytospin-A-like isoform X1 [Arapaima gigas]
MCGLACYSWILMQLKEEFDTHCDEAKREADLQRGKVVEKEAQVADLKEVIYELEDEVEQHRAVKLYDNHTIAYLENSVRKIQNEKRDVDCKIKALQHKFKVEAAEWHQLQADLQTAVAVANTMTSQAKEETEELRQQLHEAQQRIDKLSREIQEERSHKQAVERAKVHHMSSAEGDLPALRTGMRGCWCFSTSSSSNVKSLIRSFECISQGPAKSTRGISTASNKVPFGFSSLKTLVAVTLYPVQWLGLLTVPKLLLYGESLLYLWKEATRVEFVFKEVAVLNNVLS